MTASIIGFKTPQADLHRKSPKIFAASVVASLVLVGVGLNTPFYREAAIEKKVEKPPVIIELQDIPETHQAVRAPAPKLAIPIEVEDDMMPDDVTIESTDLDLSDAPTEPPPVLEMVREQPQAETVEEEIFEFFAVEEKPVKLQDIAPEYPEAARQAGIEGMVFVRALVNGKGVVERAEVLRGPAELHEAAITAARRTPFQPAKQNDMPVSCWVQMTFRFELQ